MDTLNTSGGTFYTLKDFARAYHINYQWLHKWAKRKHIPKFKMLYILDQRASEMAVSDYSAITRRPRGGQDVFSPVEAQAKLQEVFYGPRVENKGVHFLSAVLTALSVSFIMFLVVSFLFVLSNTK